SDAVRDASGDRLASFCGTSTNHSGDQDGDQGDELDANLHVVNTSPVVSCCHFGYANEQDPGDELHPGSKMLPIPHCWVPEGSKPSTEQGGCSNDVQKDEKRIKKIHVCTLQDFIDKVSIKSPRYPARDSGARFSNCVSGNLSDMMSTTFRHVVNISVFLSKGHTYHVSSTTRIGFRKRAFQPQGGGHSAHRNLYCAALGAVFRASQRRRLRFESHAGFCICVRCRHQHR